MPPIQRNSAIVKSKSLRTYMTLVILTAATMLLSMVDLGGVGVVLIALLVFIQLVLIARHFLFLYRDDTHVTVVLSLAVVFVVLFLGLALLDTAFRHDFGNVERKSVRELQREEEILRSLEPAPETQRVAPADFPSEADLETSSGQ